VHEEGYEWLDCFPVVVGRFFLYKFCEICF
jgi:hypothetical protein